MEIAVEIWAIFFVAAFAIEFVWNRRPLAVALIVPAIGFACLILWDWQGVQSDLSDALVPIYASIAIFGILPSLAGAGLARFIRLWNAVDDGPGDSANRAEE